MISVIIPAYNAAETITACVQALHQQTRPDLLHEIIVVDNNSSDDTAALAQTAGATVIHQPKPGAAAARNAGIAAATGSLICVTDADCEPTADWLEQLSAPLRENPDITACKGSYLTRQPELVARFVQIEYEDKYDLLRQQEYIDFIDTYSAAYRRDALAQHPFDENIFYVEDQELSFRLAAHGHKMVFQPAAVVYHLHSDTLRQYFHKKVMIAYWKAQVVRRFPQRAAKDSHTPQIMKIQMGLVTLFWAALAFSLIFPPLGLPASVLLLLAFLLTTIPFTRKAWGKEKPVALASPFFLFIRALALSLGYIWGTLSPAPEIATSRSRWQNLKIFLRTLRKSS